jgi:hypothetical protein
MKAVSYPKLLRQALLDEHLIYIGFMSVTVFSQDAAPEHTTYEYEECRGSVYRVYSVMLGEVITFLHKTEVDVQSI